jgi:hypothetical protein
VNEREAIRKTYTLDTQDDSEEKINILGGDCVCYCDKSSYNHMCNCEWLRSESTAFSTVKRKRKYLPLHIS